MNPAPQESVRPARAGAILCLVAGLLHLLGGRFLAMLFGVAYVAAAVGLFVHWRPARGLARTVAGLRIVGTVGLLMIKLPGLLGGSGPPETLAMVVRDMFWLAMNIVLLLVLHDESSKERDQGRGGCV